MTESESERGLRELVALGCRILGANGHDDYVWGHVSARDPEGRGVWMKASTFGFDEITAEHVVLVSSEGDVLVGDHPRHLEWPIHTEVMRARPDVSSVVHSHPAHSIALGASGQPLLALSHAATMFVPPDVPRYTRTGELITSVEMGQEVAAAIAQEPACLLVNHGIVTAGADVREAVIRAVVLERAAHQQMLVRAFGEVERSSPDDEALHKRATVWSDAQVGAMWAYLERRLAAGLR
jgi:L-fuculose-phosphate aldolase